MSNIEANVAGNVATFTNTSPYFRFGVVDANGNTIDACPDAANAGFHDTIVYLHPSANNKDVIMALTQMALLNRAEIVLSTEHSTHGGRLLCFIKQIRLTRS